MLKSLFRRGNSVAEAKKFFKWVNDDATRFENVSLSDVRQRLVEADRGRHMAAPLEPGRTKRPVYAEADHKAAIDEQLRVAVESQLASSGLDEANPRTFSFPTCNFVRAFSFCFDSRESSPIFSLQATQGLFTAGVVFKNARIGSADLAASPGDPRLDFIGCWIGTLTLSHRRPANVLLRDCYIARLVLSEQSLGQLEIDGGWIGRIHIEPNVDEIVTTACLIRPNAVLADYSSEGDIAEIQPYRKLRVNLDSKADELTRALLHAVELRLERPREVFVHRYLNLAFDKFTNYGNSPGRSVGVLVLVWAFTAFGLFCLDSGQVALDCSHVHGWHDVLCGQAVTSDLARSLVLSAQSLTNPLGVFGARQLVVPNSSLTAFVLGLVSIIALSLAAIIVIGVRRRFKLV